MKILKALLIDLPPKSKDLGLLVLRVTLGTAMIYGHGLKKMDALFAGGEISFADPFGIGPEASLVLAVFAEVLCSCLLIFGLFTRMALIPLIITMLVALFIVHGGDAFATQEKAMLYGVAYVALFLTGAGAYSLDAKLKKRS